VSCAMVIWLAYTYGGENLQGGAFKNGGTWLFSRVAGFQQYHVYTDWTVVGCMTAGAGFMGWLLYMHRTYLWWPLHPLGYIIGGTVASTQIWFPVFLGWLARALVRKLAGAAACDRFKPIALGLLIGEFGSVGLWLLIDAITGMTLHRVFPTMKPF
jgi:hypothetical protein